ncbi:MAG: hypothetical protein JXB07_18870 [Anaerolineae bacterium]|nr:hypothetical protein [Anaerolineae bacterium]
MAELYLESVPDDLANALTLELMLFRATQMYHCTRHEAIVELGAGDLVADPDPWAVKIHFEFVSMVERLRNRKA